MKRKGIGRILGRIGIGVLVVCGIIGAVWHEGVRVAFKNMTMPRIKMEEEVSWDGGTTYMHLPYAEASESEYLDLYVPNTGENREQPKLFVMVHGGGFVFGDSQTRQTILMYRYMRDHGYACATINYRLAGEAGFPAALQDVKAAVRYLRAHAEEFGYDASKVAIWGESAGGYMASIAAMTNDDEFNDLAFIGQEEAEAGGEKVSALCDVLVDYYGCVDLTGMDEDWKTLGIPKILITLSNLWTKSADLEGYKNFEEYFMRLHMDTASQEEIDYSSVAAYTAENMPGNDRISVMIVHGGVDITVPRLQSERFAEQLSEWLSEDRLTYRVVPDSGHASDILYTDEELSIVEAFLNEHM